MFSDNFRYFIAALRESKTTFEVYDCWKMISSEYPDTKITIGVSSKTDLSIPKSLKSDPVDNKAFLRSYYSTDSLYFLNSELLERISVDKRTRLNFDGAIFLDTNIASYIDSFVQRKLTVENNQDFQRETIVGVIDYLLTSGLTYDYMYYIIENTKLVFPIFTEIKGSHCTPQFFWNQLQSRFKNNLISLLLFQSIDREVLFQSADREVYENLPHVEYEISYEEAESEAIKQTHDLYFGKYAEIPVKIIEGYNMGESRDTCKIVQHLSQKLTLTDFQKSLLEG